MNTNEYLAHFIDSLHNGYQEALAGLTEDQLYYRLNDETCHIAFHAWHFIRTKDNVINFVLQNRKPPVWMRQELHEKWNLPKVAQGTGMAREDAHALRLPSLDAFLQYANDVHVDTMAYVQSADADELAALTKMTPWGELPKLQHIGQAIISHGNGHLGQIDTMRAAQSLPGQGF